MRLGANPESRRSQRGIRAIGLSFALEAHSEIHLAEMLESGGDQRIGVVEQTQTTRNRLDGALRRNPENDVDPLPSGAVSGFVPTFGSSFLPGSPRSPQEARRC